MASGGMCEPDTHEDECDRSHHRRGEEREGKDHPRQLDLSTPTVRLPLNTREIAPKKKAPNTVSSAG